MCNNWQMIFFTPYRWSPGSMSWRPILRFGLALVIGVGIGSASAEWPPSAGWLAARGDPKGIFVIDAAKGNIVKAFPTASAERAQSGRLLPATETIVSTNARLMAISQPNGGIQVWDLSLDRLVWRHAGARAIGFLGSDGRRIAVLIRPPGASTVEFAVWQMDADRKVFSRIVSANIQAVPQALGSERFAVFTTDQREIWVWDDVPGVLRPVPLPDKALVDEPEIRWPSNGEFRSMVLAPDGRTLVFGGYMLRLRSMDLAAWTAPRRYDYPDGSLGQFFPLGISANGRYLLAWNQSEFLQFDLVAGSLVHKWTVYSDEIRTFPRPKGLWWSRQDAKHIHARLAGFPEVSRDGRLLAIWDYVLKVPVVFDITRSPPQEVSPPRRGIPVCDASTRTCGNGIEGGRRGHIRFIEPGGDLVVLAIGGRVDADALWRFDRLGKLGQMLPWPTVAEQVAALPPPITEEALARGKGACGSPPNGDCRGEPAVPTRQVWPSWAHPGTERPMMSAPGLCARLLEDKLAIVGVRHEVDGRFVGIRLVGRTLPPKESWPFAPGDVLFNGGWCADSGCDDREFQQALWRTCSSSRLVRDVRLEVGSAEPARNRVLVLTSRSGQ